MPSNRTQTTRIAPGADLTADVTVFVTTVGAPSFEACLRHLDEQDVHLKRRIIDHVAPMNAAFQKMLDDCTTPYYVQVDEDMLLKPHAIRWLYERIRDADPDVAMVVGYLFDAHLGRPVQGVKMFRHDIARKFPLSSVEACEMDQNQQLVSGGYRLRIFRLEEFADSDDGILGLHGTHWTPKTIFERYATLERKYRRFPERMVPIGEWPGLIFQRFLDEGSELDLFAVMGAIAGRLAPLEGGGVEKDYRAYDNLPGFKQAQEFIDSCADSPRGRLADLPRPGARR